MIGQGIRLAAVAMLFWVLGFAAVIHAAVQVPLYEERIVVSMNADQRELNAAMRQGLERVFVRVSGSSSILTEPAVVEALGRSANFVSASRFTTSNEFFTNILGERVATKQMVLNYDRKQVEDLLVRNRLPVWRDFRPEVMVWIAERIDGNDRIIADSDTQSTAQAMRQQAQRRGVPLILPILDLEDTLSISFADVYGLFSSDIERASERYQPDAILTGRINRIGNDYQADWLFLFKGERLRLPTVVGSEQEVVEAAISLAAQRLTQQYAFVFDPNLIGTYSLVLDEIDSLEKLASVERYLRSINLITKVTLRSLNDQQVVYDLQISGDRSQLVDVFDLDKALAPSAEFSLETQMDRQLRYRWIR